MTVTPENPTTSIFRGTTRGASTSSSAISQNVKFGVNAGHWRNHAVHIGMQLSYQPVWPHLSPIIYGRSGRWGVTVARKTANSLQPFDSRQILS